jgi:hypothetical protein
VASVLIVIVDVPSQLAAERGLALEAGAVDELGLERVKE